jgi:hypothetical protein
VLLQAANPSATKIATMRRDPKRTEVRCGDGAWVTLLCMV